MKPLVLIAFFILMVSCATADVPQLIIRTHPSQITPAESPIQEIRADNQFYSTANDPSLVTFISATDRKLYIIIDGRHAFYLLPNKSKCFAFPIFPGHHNSLEHTAEVRVERPTRYYGSWDTVRKFNFYIRLDGQPQIFYLYDQ